MFATKLGYNKVLITNGLDQRGINVALLVRESKNLEYVSHKEIEVTTAEMRKPTRNVLHVQFKTGGSKFLNVFVNHRQVKTIRLETERSWQKNYFDTLKI